CEGERLLTELGVPLSRKPGNRQRRGGGGRENPETEAQGSWCPMEAQERPSHGCIDLRRADSPVVELLGQSSMPPRNRGHTQEIDSLDRPVRAADPDRPSRWRLSQAFGMIHRQSPSVGEMDIKRLKWPCLVQMAQLLNGHTRRLA